MENKIVKLGVVGLKRGMDVALEVAKDNNVAIKAVCDISESAINNAKIGLKNVGVSDYTTFNNYEDMLANADIDAVYIATDAVCHVPYVEKALDAGKHVISEIPVVNSVEEAKTLKAAVKRHPELKYMAGENCFYWAFIQAWRSMYVDGKIGEAVYAESEYLHSEDYKKIEAPKTEKDKNHWRMYNPAIKYLTHNLGPLLHIMDDKCVSVSCMNCDSNYNPYREDKNSVAIFKTKKGAVIRILIVFDAYVGFDHNFSIIGTRGTIETDKTKPLSEAHSFARFSDIPGTISQKVDIPVTLRFPGENAGTHGGADRKMMRDFIKCIINDEEPPIDVDMGINITLPGIIAAESAARGGELMEIPEI